MSESPIVKYSPADAEIAILAQEAKTMLATLQPGTPERYEALRVEIGKARTFRTSIEKTRVELKADALAWGRKVDQEAKRLTSLILSVEDPMRREKEAEDQKKEAIARAAVEAEKARLAAIEQAARDAEEARLKALRDAEEARIAAERKAMEIERARMAEEKRVADAAAAEARKIEDAKRKAEADRLEAERKAFEAERRLVAEEQHKIAQAQEAERRRIAEESAKIEQVKRAEADRLARIEFEKKAMEAAEAKAKERARLALIEAEAKRKADEEERQRQEAARPDVVKVREFGQRLSDIQFPEVGIEAARAFLAQIGIEIIGIAQRCSQFAINKKKGV